MVKKTEFTDEQIQELKKEVREDIMNNVECYLHLWDNMRPTECKALISFLRRNILENNG